MKTKITLFICCFLAIITAIAQPPENINIDPNIDDKAKTESIKNTPTFKKAYQLKDFRRIPKNTSDEEGASAETSTKKEGINLETYEDITDLLGDDKYESFLEKLNISREIYPDKNLASNYYYYLPSTYTLKWDKDVGKYAFHIFYLSSEDVESNEVLVKFELVSNIHKKDLELAEKFLQKKESYENIQLLPMPVQGLNIDFGSALTNYSIKPESISITPATDYLKPIIVEWKMEQKVDDFVGAMLSNFGLDSNVEFLLEDGETVSLVPLNLRISDPTTFGKLEVKNTTELKNGWKNYLDYPIALKRLVAHKKNSNTLETFDLNNVEVAPGETFTYTETSLQGNYDYLWLDYSILECKECKEIVRKKIIGGTSGSQITKLNIEVFNIMEISEAYMFKLNIKSIQADPNGISEVTQPSITIREDDQSFFGGKYYVPENEELSYQYQLIQIMPSGETKISPWKTGNQNFLIIGESQLETIFTEEPSAKDPTDLESATDSLFNQGKKLLENLFKKKKDTVN